MPELSPSDIDPAIRSDVAYRVLEGHSPEEALRLVLAEREEALEWAVRPARRRELRLERSRENLEGSGRRVVALIARAIWRAPHRSRIERNRGGPGAMEKVCAGGGRWRSRGALLRGLAEGIGSATGGISATARGCGSS
jgi:hypothetical protein